MTNEKPKTETKPDPRTDGCWLAYDSGFNQIATFSSEMQALRYAVINGLKVARVTYGVDLRQAVKTSMPSTVSPITSSGA